LPNTRWQEEGAQIIDLIYRIQVEHGGRIPEAEAHELAPWAASAAKRAEQLHWIVSKETPPVLKVTNGGLNALKAALAARNAAIPDPHWLGGSIRPREAPSGPVIPPAREHYDELKKWALEQGILTQEDIDRAAQSPVKEREEPGEFRILREMSFPGVRWFAATRNRKEIDPLGGDDLLDPVGSEGPYQVTVTLTRRGAPDVPFLYVTDAYALEGDSHLWLREERREDGAVGQVSFIYRSGENEETQFDLLTNPQGRLGQIRTVLRAGGIGEASRNAYKLLNPFLCDLSYRYDIPIEVLQTNIVELATLTASGWKHDDFPEKVFDYENFYGPTGLSYEVLHLYEFFTALYREGVNSLSVNYGFLCFFRIAEGVMKLRRKRINLLEGRKVSFEDVVLPGEIIQGDGADVFPSEMRGKTLWEACKKLYEYRDRLAHAFLNREDPVAGHEDIITDRLESEEHASTRRAQARYIARRMLKSEFWASSKPD
jgi:hypothetical protein